MSGAVVKRASITHFSPSLHCRIVSGIGHFWRCDRCGAQGKIRDYDTAQAEKRLHVCADLAATGSAEAS